MEELPSWFNILFIFIFILIAFLLHAFGSALQNLNVSKLKNDRDAQDSRAAKLLDLVDAPSLFISSLHIITKLMTFISALLLFPYFRQLLTASGISPIVKLLIVLSGLLLALFLFVCLAVIIPKRLALASSEAWAAALYPFVSLLMAVTKVFALFCELLSKYLLKLFKVDFEDLTVKVTEEYIVNMVNLGKEKGTLEAGRADMILNVNQLKDRGAADVMTHRKNIIALDKDLSLKEAIDFILREGSNSRYPVYSEDIDDIVGILNLKDALVYANKGVDVDRGLTELPSLLRSPYFVPETMNLDNLFKQMQSKKLHMAIVVDEYGQTAGIVTMEDILEKIVGNILDEYDEDKILIKENMDGSYEVDGMISIEEFSKFTDIHFSDDDLGNFDTLSGFIIAKLDRIPSEDEYNLSLDLDGIRYTCINIENKMIRTLRVEKLKQEEVKEILECQDIQSLQT